MIDKKIILCDTNSVLCNYWEEYFKDEPNVEIHNDDFREIFGWDCIVSPGNSFGLMTGGIDKHIIEFFGQDLMKRVQGVINVRYFGEQPVGTSILVGTGHYTHRFLCHAPTMRVPKVIKGTDAPYLAMRAVLIEIMYGGYSDLGINTILIPGLGAGTGLMNLKSVAHQMYWAYMSIKNPYVGKPSMVHAIAIDDIVFENKEEY
jgi:O-acetyl-ADP-ribose deacetylase (regulator of RNase III)